MQGLIIRNSQRTLRGEDENRTRRHPRLEVMEQPSDTYGGFAGAG
jgi:hypothetical protein